MMLDEAIRSPDAIFLMKQRGRIARIAEMVRSDHPTAPLTLPPFFRIRSYYQTRNYLWSNFLINRSGGEHAQCGTTRP